MKLKKLLWMMIGAGLIFSACDKNDNDGNESAVEPMVIIPLDAQTRGVVEHNNDFAFDIFKAQASEKECNTVVSSISAFLNLSMVANGDDGSVRKELESVLGYENNGNAIADINDYAKVMLKYLPEVDKKTTCVFANACIYKSNLTLLSDYQNLLVDYFDAEVSQFYNFQEAIDKINNWVKEKTDGNIESMIDSSFDNDLAILSANYFKGKWASEFDSRSTKVSRFDNIDKSIGHVDMMSQKSKLLYNETEDYQLVSLPYGNGNYEMIVVLPAWSVDFYTFVKEFDRTELEKSIADAIKVEVNLDFPKFEINQTTNLLETLREMGVQSLELQEVRGMVNESMKIRKIDQIARIKVDEEGTVAAAVTISGVSVSSPDPGLEYTMNCCHPFIYMIRETTTGTILYIGKVVKF
ncbi:MAG: serpin family protein [Bacteroidales bacterium]|nr:serpin family protein [Bacteroidales bacterium]MBD5205691.1 serpin family protein [Bacteroidales bacterium]MBD5224048.1 serpin family protein [Bacteroidales bacterium]